MGANDQGIGNARDVLVSVKQYQMGPESLKRHLRELLASRGVNCREDQIYLTTGAQQAIHLLVNLLLNKGDQVLIEEVTYEGLHNAILPSRPQVLIIPTDPATGMNVDAVEAQLVQGARPAFIYVVTDGQITVSTYLDTGELPAHLAILRREYGIRRDTMLRALESHFPPEAQWKKPSSGMFIWVELPREINTVELLRMAVETERVAFMPGAFFGIGGSGGARNGMRLNFTHCSPEQIQDGVSRLASVLKELIGRGEPDYISPQ